MERENGNKALRVLSMYQKLMNNQIVNKAEEAAAYGVNSRTIQRDIDDIRGFLETTDSAGISKQIVYDQKERGYRLEEVYDENLTAGEALAVCKILIDSRAFPKDKMKKLIYQIVGSSVPEPEQKHIYELVNNELFHYIEPRHKTDCSEMLWQIGEAVRTNHYIEIEYQRTKDKSIVTRRLRPAAIMFSEYYFYLTAFIDDEVLCQYFDVSNDTFPTIYRIDRIKKLIVLDEQIMQLNQRYKDNWNVASMAEYCKLSVGYFSHIFKKRIGVAPMRYLNELRVEKAKELIATNAMKLSDIASMVGFSNPLYFSRVFNKKTAGIPPKEFQQSLLTSNTPKWWPDK